jgi:cellulose synthase/poly-beta-1,6-N-acetylglucosamine synthase-like glycosyltransferase
MTGYIYFCSLLILKQETVKPASQDRYEKKRERFLKLTLEHRVLSMFMEHFFRILNLSFSLKYDIRILVLICSP